MNLQVFWFYDRFTAFIKFWLAKGISTLYNRS